MFQQEIDFLRATRADTLALAEPLEQSQADFAPAPGRWSVGEVLDHLLLAENLYRQVIGRLVEMAKAGQRAVINDGFREVNTSIGYIPKPFLPFLEVPLTVFNMFVPTFVREAMTEFRLLPAQNPDIAQPARGRPIGELRRALRESYRQTAALLEANPNLNYRRLRYRHPLLGDNDVMHVLRIVSFHERRHQSQIREILKARRFPSTSAA